MQKLCHVLLLPEKTLIDYVLGMDEATRGKALQLTTLECIYYSHPPDVQ